MNYCAACLQLIADGQFLVALDMTWHEFCLKCACCNCQLTGDRFYLRSGLLLCAIDYVRIFGRSGQCCLCSGIIRPIDWTMVIDKGKQLFAHLECFACWKCGYRLLLLFAMAYYKATKLIVHRFTFKILCRRTISF
ncbi:hypothetical protein ACQ4LE_004214 [Meloidogyne hapla]